MTTIDRQLQSIGHRCFRNCYETAGRRGEKFGIADLLRCDPALWETRPKALATRASKIRKLVREGRAAAALAMVERAQGTGMGAPRGERLPQGGASRGDEIGRIEPVPGCVAAAVREAGAAA